MVSLTICTAYRAPWCNDAVLCQIVVDEATALHDSGVAVIGFCVMPDHVHLLISTAGRRLSEIVRLFKGRVARRVRKEKPDLVVWQRGYFDHVVRRSEGIYRTLEYLFQNPVRAGLVEHWWDFKWLGSPLLGEVSEGLFSITDKADAILWSDLIGSAD